MMKNPLIVLSLLILSSVLFAQKKPLNDHSKLNIDCKTCHICDVPTKSDPCLVKCPREKLVTVYQKPEQTPRLIVLDQLSKRYSPVYFSHRMHAQMSEMGGGCEACHHFNTSAPIMKCNSCHEPVRKRENVSVPDLNAAYHRQCIDCHREWSGTTDCNSCHIPKKDMKGNESLASLKKYTDKDHPKVIEPTKFVYQTKSNEGKQVVFFHNDHTKKFGIECIICHKQEGCSKCHGVNKVTDVSLRKVTTKRTFEEQHKNCISCHSKSEKCSKCHSDKDRQPFDHAKSTGWALGRFHSALSCAKCHTSKLPFKKLNNQCVSCHAGWNNENFNHRVTGLQLDETHRELNCDDCHTDNKYSVKPSCDNCHEGYAYPKYKPGKQVRK